MNPLVIYHASCADGFGAAFAAWLKLGDDAEYVPMQYLDSKLNAVEAWEALSAAIPSKANTGREVYILDFSLPKPVMDKLFAVSERVVWLDHHKTAFEMWCEDGERSLCEQSNGRDEVILDNNKSGAMLAWEYFHPGEEIPQFIRHIDDYDRWQFKIEGTKAFQKALWSITPWSFKQWQHEWDSTWGYGSGDGLEGLPSFIRDGNAILRAHDQNVQSVVKGSARPCHLIHVKDQDPSWYQTHEHWEAEFDVDATGLAANCPPHLQSDVGHELANQSGTFGLLWSIDKDGQCKCSLRSNGGYDVSAIAKAFGGGGHRNAAGFTTSIQTLLEWTK